MKKLIAILMPIFLGIIIGVILSLTINVQAIEVHTQLNMLEKIYKLLDKPHYNLDDIYDKLCDIESNQRTQLER